MEIFNDNSQNGCEHDDNEENDNTWENIKENAAPLERGRNVGDLKKTFALSNLVSEVELRKNEKTKRRFEKLIAPAEIAAENGQEYTNTDDKDPLVHWLSYIKFVQDTYPADTQQTFLLMERCTRTFVAMEQYRNDRRFIRVCVLYAERTSSPADVFKFLHARKIGYKVAIFWVAWAFIAEKAGNYAFAEKVFKKALEKDVEPKKYVKERHIQFQRRMSRHWLNNAKADCDVDSSHEDEGDERGKLASLTEEGARMNHRSRPANPVMNLNENAAPSAHRMNMNRPTTSIGRSRPTNPSMSSGQSGFSRRIEQMSNSSRSNRTHGVGGTGFSIYVENTEHDTDGFYQDGINQRRKLETEAERKKENTLEAEEWNKHGGLDNPYVPRGIGTGSMTNAFAIRAAVAAPVSFDVFVDEECEGKNDEDRKRGKSHHKQKIPQPLIKERLGDAVADRLTKDPLRYVNDPKKYAIEKGNDRPAIGKNLLSEKVDTLVNTKASNTKDNRKSNSTEAYVNQKIQINYSKGFNPSLLLSEHGNEQCLEEARAHTGYYRLAPANDNFNRLQQKFEVAVPLMDTSDSESSEMSVEDDTMHVVKQQTRRVAFAVFNENLERAAHNESYASQASSVVNEHLATGGSFHAEEQTINTKLAAAEMSVMFASPVDGKSREDQENESEDEDDCGDDDHLAPHSYKIINDDGSNQKNQMDNSIFANTLHSPKNSPVIERVFGSRTRRQETKLAARASKVNNSAFMVFKDETIDMQISGNINQLKEADGDTASLSAMIEFGCDIAGSILKNKARKNQDCDENSTPFQTTKHKNERVTKGDFGDISVIADDEISVHQTQTPAVNPFTEKKKGRCISSFPPQNTLDYDIIYRDSISAAMAEVVLGVNVVDCRGQLLPPALNRKNPLVGTEFKQLNDRYIVKHELGRGSFGIVLLCSRQSGDEEDRVALKIQSPTDSLVHEFRILSSLTKRVPQIECNIFPTPLNFFAYGNGGLLSMTAASTSGINLVDLANIYQRAEGGPIPELIALYYTSRMLCHLETLHSKGRIMHCDVKPDNWVLTKSKKVDSLSAEANELLLCDFGKAIDLMEFGSDSSLSFRFRGSPVTNDMKCGSMRDGKPWSYEVDTFGLCASTHVLLFGSHMEVKKISTTSRWTICKTLRRYWEKSLWQEFFDSLLNNCEGGLSSNLLLLRSLSERLEVYLNTPSKQEELRALLHHQDTFLPKKKN